MSGGSAEHVHHIRRADKPVEISWDEWAVPTVVADDELDVTFGVGYAQARTNAGLVLELYGIARGCAAALWGAEFLAEDTFGARLGLDAQSDVWFDAQSPETIARIAAFCEGFNAACAEDPVLGAGRREALPVTPRDVVAHALRVFVRFSTVDATGRAFAPDAFVDAAGSNGWAVSGRLSSTGNAQLIINPHLGWQGYHRWFEVRTVHPGRDFHGAQLMGLPWQNIGYSPAVAWGHTVNPVPNLTVYELDLVDGTYLFDGERRPVTTVEHRIEVAGGAAATVTERRSVHGPIVTAPDGAEVAVRMAGSLHHPATSALEGWWRMSRAGGVAELFAIHDASPLPLFNVIAADSAGSIGALYCGTPPVLPGASHADLQRRLPGHDPTWLWDAVHPASSMPRVLDPECGWVQNCNETPWLYTDPPLDPSEYPASIAPSVWTIDDLRPHASRGQLVGRERITPDELLGLKYTTRALLADLVLDDLLAAAAGREDLRAAVEVLTAWDRHCHHDSGGYLLFLLWGLRIVAQIADHTLLERPAEPGGMPGPLRDPASGVEVLRAAVDTMAGLGLPLDASIGQVLTLGSGEHAVPADGGSGVLGVLKSLEITAGASGVRLLLGDTWISHVRFGGEHGPLARSLLVYGNTTEPSAPPARSQYALWGADRLRPQRSDGR
ncbi:penicillin acylase family protein [Saccharothrix coeruleofusca]|uniref:penicillin acylase family protein n=1 Tax=Saccharothrix coeruleofusca TaxID=33919 RepID=UPI0016708F33|nr:penicillin acylase family protein [Saccharothrix coeruleofusca]